MQFKINTSQPQDILLLFENTGSSFKGDISINQNIKSYVDKIYLRSNRYELWISNELIALLAFYTNSSADEIYVTSMSISEKYQGMGYGKYLFEKLFAQAKSDEVESIRLEVKHYNERALSFYKSLNFVVMSKQNLNLVLEKIL